MLTRSIFLLLLRIFKRNQLFRARNIINSLLIVYPVEIAPYGKHVFLISKIPSWDILQRKKSLHMQMTVIFPYIIVWDMLNEITCLSFMSLDFTVLFYFQYFDASVVFCSLILYMTIKREQWSKSYSLTVCTHFVEKWDIRCMPFLSPPSLLLGLNGRTMLCYWKPLKKKSMHAILYSNVLFISVHKLMLVSFILCIELITFDSIFALFLFFLFL